MTNEQIVEAIRAGDHSLMGQLWAANKGMVYRTARRYTRDGAELEDLAMEGYIIMDAAVKTWDPVKCSFIVWLTHSLEWGYIRIILHAGGQHIPQRVMAAAVRYDGAKQRFTELVGRKPTDRELAIYMGISVKVLDEARRAMVKPLRLDEPVTEDGQPLHEIIPAADDVEGETITRADNERLHKALDEALSTLTRSHADIIRRRYYQGQDYDTISSETGTDKKELQRAATAAMNRLRHSQRVRRILSPYTEIYGEATKGVSVRRFRETGESATERTALKLCG